MKRISFHAILFIGLCLLTSCVDHNITPDIPITEDFFDWKTTNQIELTIPVASISGDMDKYCRTVNIYSSSTYSQGSLMITGSALPDEPFSCIISVPTFLSEIYIEVLGPDGSKERSSLVVTPYTTDSSDSDSLTKAGDFTVPSIEVPDIDIPSDFDVEFTEDIVQYTEVNNDNTYLVPAGYDITSTNLSLYNKSLWQDARLYVAGKLTFNNSVNGKRCSIIVLDGGEVVLNNDFVYNAVRYDSELVLYVMQGGKITFNQGMKVTDSRIIVNKGELTVAPQKSINISKATTWNGPDLFNTGIIRGSISGMVDGKPLYDKNIVIKVDNNSHLHNDGEIYADLLSCDNSWVPGTDKTLVNYSSGLIDVNEYYQKGISIYNNDMAYNYGFLSAQKMEIAAVNLRNTGFIGVGLGNAADNSANLLMEDSNITLYDGSLLEAHIMQLGNTHIEMRSGSIISVDDLSKSSGWGSGYQLFSNDNEYSLLIVNENLQSLRKSGSTILGSIEVWHKALGSNGNTMDDYRGQYNQKVRWVKDLVDRVIEIPESAYNKGYGLLTPPAPVDNDGDGVLSDVDIDDNDPTIAYRSYYPNTTDFGTILFEDLWPYPGDYDMNDLVCDYHIEWTSNAQNDVVYMDFFWKLRALGATKKVSMAFQIDNIPATTVNRVEHSHSIPTSFPMEMVNGMEIGQEHPVIPLFNDADELWGEGNDTFINTIPDFPLYPTATENCRIYFQEPISLGSVMVDRINPFIITSSFDQPSRNWEVHLAGFKRTNRASTIINNQGGLSRHDPYISNTGFMWGLMLPQSLTYTRESVNIESAYLHYRDWYISKGTAYTDWYMDKPGYINSSALYSRNN